MFFWKSKKDKPVSVDSCTTRTESKQSFTSSTRTIQQSAITIQQKTRVRTEQITRQIQTNQQQIKASRSETSFTTTRSPNTKELEDFRTKFFETPAIKATSKPLPNKLDAVTFTNLPHSSTSTTYSVRGPLAQSYLQSISSQPTAYSSTKPNSAFKTTKISDARPFNSSTVTTATPVAIRTAPLNRALIIPTPIATTKTITAQRPLTKYSRSVLKPGIAVILNSVDFDKEPAKQRIGSDFDVELISRALKKYKVEIWKNIRNPTVQQIEKTVNSLIRLNLKNRACIIFVILSHGSENDIVAASDDYYNINSKILKYLIDCSSLQDTPKIFIVQACKGSNEPKWYKDATPIHSGAPTEILKCYCTFEGFVGYRTEKGSPFIKALCKEIDEKGHNTDLVKILDNVRVIVKNETRNQQIPSHTTTLTRPFVFGDYV